MDAQDDSIMNAPTIVSLYVVYEVAVNPWVS